ncbi:F-box domain-containing protein [Entamoeba marina]
MSLSKDYLIAVIQHLDVEDLITFSQINHKTQSILSNIEHNFNCTGAVTKQEFDLLPNAKTITGELYSIVFSLCVTQEDDKLSDNEFWEVVQKRWETICQKYNSFEIYCNSGIDAHTIPLLVPIAEKIIFLSIHTKILPTGLCFELIQVLNKMTNLTKLRIDGVTLSSLCAAEKSLKLPFKTIIFDSINMKKDARALLLIAPTLTGTGIIHIDNCRNEKDIEVVKKCLPNFVIAVDFTTDASMYSEIANKQLLFIPSYHAPFAISCPEDLSNIETINNLYLPTLHFSLPNKIIDAFGMIIIGKLPNELHSDKLAYLRYNNIIPETVPLNLSSITTLTRLELRMNEPRKQIVNLPPTLKTLDIEIQDNMDGFCKVNEEIGISNLTNLTNLSLKFSDTKTLTLPKNIMVCSIAMCPLLQTISFDNTNALTRLEVQACEKVNTLQLPNTVKLAMLVNCPSLETVKAPKRLERLQHTFDKTIKIEYQ